MKRLFVIFLLAAVIVLCILMFHDVLIAPGHAEQPEGTTAAYVICTPGDYVNIRPRPNKKGDEIGRFEPGEVVYLDGVRKGEYLHCVGLRLEDTEGWVHMGYVLYDPPEEIGRPGRIVAKGRVAARKNVNGRRTRWLKPGTELTVHYWSNEWCLTSKGYVQSQFVEIDYGEDEEL